MTQKYRIKMVGRLTNSWKIPKYRTQGVSQPQNAIPSTHAKNHRKFIKFKVYSLNKTKLKKIKQFVRSSNVEVRYLIVGYTNHFV